MIVGRVGWLLLLQITSGPLYVYLRSCSDSEPALDLLQPQFPPLGTLFSNLGFATPHPGLHEIHETLQDVD